MDTQGRTCTRCGARLSPDAPEGLCAACVLTAGMETITRDNPEDLSEAPTHWGGGRGAPEVRSGEVAPGTQRLATGQAWGPYQIGRLLGAGGMGEVYEVRHRESGRRMALKVLRDQLRHPEDRARFLREGQLAASVSHPHTVYIFGSEEIAGMPVISMELLPGGTLKDRVAAEGPLSAKDAVSAVLNIIGGLDAAQAVGILHRDIKPSNCFLDNEGAVKVGDFGLSISTLARDVMAGAATSGFQGTPQFAAPEQLRGEPLDVRADIYAVGATLYYLLTGQPPFDAPNLRELVKRATEDPAPSPRRLRPEIPQGLASVVLRCLAKSPGERPASYAVLADALRPFSTRSHEPARPGIRFVAGVLDSLLLMIPATVLVVARGNIITDPNAAASLSAYSWIFNAVYYFLLEGFGGASLGKRAFGLRVTSADGLPASLLSIAVRTAVFFTPAMLMMILTLMFSASAASIDAFRPLLAFVFLAVMCSSMRRRNGWATLADLASRTRVVAVAKAPVTSRRLVAATPDSTDAPKMKSRQYGPFTAASEAWVHSDGSLLWAFDPVLRRKVWIRSSSAGTPPIDAARRDTGREGRLFWLTGQRSEGNGAANWDAFEAPEGEPFLAMGAATGWAPGWATVKSWLLQLAEELAAAVREGTLPPLSLDRLWIRSDGRLVLLDFPAPGTQVDLETWDLTPVKLLWAVANHALHGPGATAPDAIPVHAHVLLNQWSGREAPSLDEAQRYLRGFATAPSTVTRWRRAVPIAVAATPIVFALALGLTLVPAFFRLIQSDSVRMLEMIESLRMPNPPASSRLNDPEFRRTFEIYLVGRYGAQLDDDAFWNSTLGNSLRDRRATAIAILERHPNVSAEELARATEIVGPDLQRRGQREQSGDRGLNVAYTIVGGLGTIATLFVVICCLVSSVLLPGGIGARLLGLAVVTRDGVEIGRVRSVARSAVAWLPAIVWLAWLAGSPRIQGLVPTASAQLWPAGVALGLVLLGGVWVVVRPSRGIHDRLTGTSVVPR